jgi:hypothetical protein
MTTEKTEKDSAVRDMIDSNNVTSLLVTIGQYYENEGLEGPINTITDLLKEAFNGMDEELGDDGSLIPRYKLWTGNHLPNQIFSICEMIRFFVKVNKDYHRIIDARNGQENIS